RRAALRTDPARLRGSVRFSDALSALSRCRALRSVIALAVALVASALAGCDGCAVERHAEAQGLDAGVVARAPSALAPATCFVLAQEQTRLFDAQIFQLCQGAQSTGPV